MADTIITQLRLIGQRAYIQGARASADSIRDIGRASNETTPGMKLMRGSGALLSSMLRGLTVVASATAATLAALAVSGAKVGLQFDASMEMATVGMTTLLKNSKLAKKTVADVRDFALKAPLLSVQDAVKSTQQLIGAGFKAKKAVPIMRTFSDTLSAMGRDPETLQRITYAFVQMMSKGQISAEELRGQLGEIFPAAKLLARGMGISMKALSDRMKEGSLKGRKYIDILMKEMNKEFHGGTKRAAATFSGMWNNIKESGKYTAGLVFMPLFLFLKDKVFPWVDKISKKIQDWAKGGGVKRLISAAGAGISEAVGQRPSRTGIGKRQLGIADVADQRAAAKKKKDEGSWLERAFHNVGKTAAKTFPLIIKYVKQFREALRPMQPFLNNVLLPLITGFGKGLVASIIGLIPVVRLIAVALGWIGTKAAPLKGIIEGIGFVIGWVFGAGKLNIIRPFGLVFQVLGRWIGKLVPALTRVGGAIAQFIGWAWKASGVARAFGGVIVGLYLKFYSTFARIMWAVIKFGAQVVGKFVSIIARIVKYFAGLGVKIASKITGSITAVVSAFVNFGQQIGKALGDAIWGALPGPIQKLLGAAGGVIAGAWNKLTGGGNKKKKRAAGGPVSGLAIVGERGPEVAQFGRGGFVYNDARMQMMNTKIPKLEVSINNHLQWRGREVALAVAGDTSDRKARR